MLGTMPFCVRPNLVDFFVSHPHFPANQCKQVKTKQKVFKNKSLCGTSISYRTPESVSRNHLPDVFATSPMNYNCFSHIMSTNALNSRQLPRIVPRPSLIPFFAGREPVDCLAEADISLVKAECLDGWWSNIG